MNPYAARARTPPSIHSHPRCSRTPCQTSQAPPISATEASANRPSVRAMITGSFSHRGRAGGSRSTLWLAVRSTGSTRPSARLADPSRPSSDTVYHPGGFSDQGEHPARHSDTEHRWRIRPRIGFWDRTRASTREGKIRRTCDLCAGCCGASSYSVDLVHRRSVWRQHSGRGSPCLDQMHRN